MERLLYLIVFLIFLGCGQNNNTNDSNLNKPNIIDRKEYIMELFKRVGIISLPFNCDILKADFKSKYTTKLNSPDTLFFESENEHVYGFLPDTSKYYCILYFQVGDLAYPKLLTIDKQGQVIDKKDLCLGVCGAPVEADTSINRFEIDEKLKIKSYYYCHGRVFTNDSIPQEVEIRDKIEAIGNITGKGKIQWTITKD